MHEQLKAFEAGGTARALPLTAAPASPASKATAIDFTAIVLAGTRREGDPLADFLGIDCKAMAQLGDRPMIQYVLEALCRSSHIGKIILVGDETLDLSPVVAAARNSNPVMPFERVASLPSLSASVLKALDAVGPAHPCLVTTADNALMTPDILAEFLTAARGNDGLSIGFVERTVIRRAYPDTVRTYLRFRDAAVSGANLFAFQGSRARNVLRFWQRIESHRKRPWKMMRAFGLVNLAGMACRRLTLARAFVRAGKVIGCKATPVCLSVAEAAMDVDTPRDFFLAGRILGDRQADSRAGTACGAMPVGAPASAACRRYAVFDLDRTITRSGTFTPFLLTSRPTLAGRAVLMARILKQMIRYKLGRIDRLGLKNRMLALAFEGMTPDAVKRLADRFVDRTLERGLRPGFGLALDMHRFGGDTLVLATASIDLYAEPFARRLGFDRVICTPTAFSARGAIPIYITGDNCYGAAKGRRVRDLLLESGALDRSQVHVSVYTDHRSDMALLEWADVPALVSPDMVTGVQAIQRHMTIVEW